jgi:hypothetical protein
MCFKYLFEKVSKTKDNIKYVQLQEVVTEPISFKLDKVLFISKTDRVTFIRDYKKLTLIRDRIILDDHDFIKYEYIVNFTQMPKGLVSMNIFAKLDSELKTFKLDDSVSSMIISFEKKHFSYMFLNELMKSLVNYKKYNSWDKKIKNFKMFKQCFK